MNDEDIKKELEQHIRIANYVDSIFCYSVSVDLLQETIALINRQQAEKERLENAIIALMSYLDILGADKTDTSFIKQATEFNKQIRADIKSEAIKEFAERLRKEVANTWFGVCCTGETEEYKEGCLFGLVEKQKHCLCIINNLLAEMVGEQDA